MKLSQDCVEYLIQDCGFDMDEASGDGTTPFHMACFGCHLPVIQYLARKGVNVHKTNDWGCDAFQFVGLTICSNKSQIQQVCNFLKNELHLDLVRTQKQGHSVLHKAAQKVNVHVIQWLFHDAGLSMAEKQKLGAPDVGGYIPSQIWNKFGGDPKVAEWMETDCGW